MMMFLIVFVALMTFALMLFDGLIALIFTGIHIICELWLHIYSVCYASVWLVLTSVLYCSLTTPVDIYLVELLYKEPLMYVLQNIINTPVHLMLCTEVKLLI